MKSFHKEILRYSNRLRRSLAYISNHPLTKRAKIQAYIRYLSFHLQQIITKNKPKSINFIEGIKYKASRSDAGITGNYYTGLANFEEMGFLLHYLRSDDVFIDVGANVGAFSLLASGVCKAKSLAIEPILPTFEKLMMNVKINSLEDLVEGLNIGIGSKTGILNFSTEQSSAMNHVVVEKTCKEPSIQIHVSTLDTIIKYKDTPSMVKIDVEGYEMEVLRGATACLSNSRCNAIIIELNGNGLKYGITDEQVFSFLTTYGFFPYEYLPFSRQLTLLDKWNTEKFNTIFIRDLNTAYSRTKSAPKRKILSRWV